MVLFVSDDAAAREDARLAFPAEIEVEVASDADEAMTLMNERTPSVVIAEIRGGHEGGFSLARSMSQQASLERVPLVMILERHQDEWLAQQAGARAWLIEPVDPGELGRVAMELVADPASSEPTVSA